MNFMELAKKGQTVEGREISCFASSFSAEKYIYLISGTHGDEEEGVFVLKELFSWLKQYDSHNWPLIVVPVLNVDGFLKKNRVNASGVDLNRNYPTSDWSAKSMGKKYHPGPAPLSEPENIFLNDLFNQYPPGFLISFHSWKPMINYNGDCKETAEFLSLYNDYPVKDDIGYAVPGSLGTYLPEKYTAPVITFECPLIKEDRTWTLESIWQHNKKGLTELFIKRPPNFRQDWANR